MKDQEVVAGSLYVLSGKICLALSAPDADGEVRIVVLAENCDSILGLLLEDADFIGHAPRSRYVPIGKDTLIAATSLCEFGVRLTNTAMARVLRQILLSGVEDFYQFAHTPNPFSIHAPKVPVSGRTFGPEEVKTLVDASLDFWLTTGRYNDAFEKRFAEFIGVPHVLTTNSGSSANLLAVSALTSPSLGERRLKPGDEVITAAAGFPTTLNPILWNSFGMDWEVDNPIISARDASFPSFETFQTPFVYKGI